jgi:hypothetical protein
MVYFTRFGGKVGRHRDNGSADYDPSEYSQVPGTSVVVYTLANSAPMTLLMSTGAGQNKKDWHAQHGSTVEVGGGGGPPPPPPSERHTHTQHAQVCGQTAWVLDAIDDSEWAHELAFARALCSDSSPSKVRTAIVMRWLCHRATFARAYPYRITGKAPGPGSHANCESECESECESDCVSECGSDCEGDCGG